MNKPKPFQRSASGATSSSSSSGRSQTRSASSTGTSSSASSTRSSTKSTGWPELGTLRKKSEEGMPYIVLNKNVEIFVNGQKVELGEYRMVKLLDPRKKIDRLVELEKMDESEADEKMTYLDEKGVKYTLTIVPDSN